MRINASQVHEARMIATHAYKLFKRFDRKSKMSVVHNQLPGMLCVSCLRQNTRTPAVTVYQGAAVCMTHLITF